MDRLRYVILYVMVVGPITSFWSGVAMGIRDVVINEFDVQGSSQYVELYDGGVGVTQLDGLAVVLFSGEMEAVYSQPLVLDGYRTTQEGYCLVSFGSPLSSANVSSSTVLRTFGLNAIALYDQTGGSHLQIGSAVTDVNLVDAVVYGSAADPQDNGLVSVLVQGQYPLQKDELSPSPDTSLSRCRGWRRIMHSSFRTARKTPGTDNDCILPSFVLNELNPTASETGGQFIEIFDGGAGFQSTDGIMLIAYLSTSPDNNIKLSLDLTGYMTNENGFLVVAGNGTNLGDVVAPVNMNSKFIKYRQTTGIALHLGPPQRFPVDAPISTYNLIDAIVYLYGRDADHALNYLLTPGQDTAVDLPSDGLDYSISRCYCCSTRNTSAFGRAPISPGATNRECSIANRTVVETPSHPFRINEVHIGTPGSTDRDFIEIYDGGFGPASLAGSVLVVYAGSQDGVRSYKVVDLLNSVTNDEGYLLIAPFSAMFMLEDDWLRAGLDRQQAVGAAALYEGSVAGLSVGDRPTVNGLLDAVVFGNQSTMASDLLEALLPGQTLIHIFLPDTSSSILRCYSHVPLDQVAFASGSPSPLAPNSCPPTPCVLNEMNTLATSSSGLWLELSCMGIPNFPLDSLVAVVLASLDPPTARSKSAAGRRTNKDGFHSVNLKVSSGPFAIALYFAPEATDLFDDEGMLRLTRVGLIDAAVVANEGAPADPRLVSVLTPGRPAVQEHEAFSHRDESLSRCLVDGNWTLVLAHVSRDAANHCPTRANPELSINELSLPTQDQFIELFDLGSGYTILDEFVVVIYNASGVASQVVPLAGYATNANGYFVLGVQSPTNVGRVNYVFPAGSMSPNTGGVALYRSTGGAFTLAVGDSATTQGLVDAVIYTVHGGVIDAALQTLVSDRKSVGLASSDQYFSRCFSAELHSIAAFSSYRPRTIAAMNDCPVYVNRDVIINEINFGEPDVTPLAYVELYDGGRGNTLLTYLTLVTFAASDNNGAYRAVDLTGYSTNEQGYFVAGSGDFVDLKVTLERVSDRKFLPHGAGAVALYRSHPGVFYHGAPATKRSLIDALVYTLDTAEETTLVEDLLPAGSSIIYEDESLEEEDGTDESISRCLGDSRVTQSAFKLIPPSPREANLCHSEGPTPGTTRTTSTTEINFAYINEISAYGAPADRFIELYDGGYGYRSLDALILVLFEKGFSIPYSVISLTGVQTDRNGYSLMRDVPELRSSGWVALYQGDYNMFSTQQAPSGRAIDQQTYSLDGIDTSLLQDSLNYPGKTFSRCASCRSSGSSYLTLAPATPGLTNRCPSSYYANQVTLTLADASYNEWQSDSSLVSALERIIAKDIDTRCRCRFSVEYLCGAKISEGSVVYQADMYATDAGQSQLLNENVQAFLAGKRELLVGGKKYLVGKAENVRTTGTPVALASVLVPALIGGLVFIAIVIAVGYVIKKRKSAPKPAYDDTIKLEEKNENEFVNPGLAGD